MRFHETSRKALAKPPGARPVAAATTGLARALSKLGFCSRKEGWELVKSGRVAVNQLPVRNPEQRITPGRDRITVDGLPIRSEHRVYLALNKPRGLVTTASDERGRATVFDCLAGADLPRLIAVGRLDQASEGLLLFTNDTAWANRLTAPESHLDKVYHVQVDRVADTGLLRAIESGVLDGGEALKAKRARLLRAGQRNSWLELVLDEGRNRHIRRLLLGLGVTVLRLVRVAIGPVQLGSLAKGQHRPLTAAELEALGGVAITPTSLIEGRPDSPPGRSSVQELPGAATRHALRPSSAVREEPAALRPGSAPPLAPQQCPTAAQSF